MNSAVAGIVVFLLFLGPVMKSPSVLAVEFQFISCITMVPTTVDNQFKLELMEDACNMTNITDFVCTIELTLEEGQAAFSITTDLRKLSGSGG